MNQGCQTLGCHWDRQYWGPAGPDILRWGHECARGIQYRDKGAPVDSGTAGVRRQLGGSRKHRGMASDDLQSHQSPLNR